jgi:hypothetical protein
MVEDEHLAYLVQAAAEMGGPFHGNFRWSSRDCWEARDRELGRCDPKNLLAVVAVMLKSANLESVTARYGDNLKAYEKDLSFDENLFDRRPWLKFNPVQVLKSCACFEYQACEYDGWRNSEARSFIEGLKNLAIICLQGYEEAEWGAPKRKVA